MDYNAWAHALGQGFTDVVTQALAYLPRALAAAAVLVVGWLVAKLLRTLSVHVVRGLDRLWHRVILRTGLEQLRPEHPPAHIVGELVFWVVVLFFVTAASQIVGLSVFANWLGQVAAYLPVLLAGLLIVLAGLIAGALVRDLVLAAASTAGFAQGELLGRAAQAVILLTAIVVGVDQIGIDVSFLSAILSIVVAAALGGMGLAFGLGARTHVSNLLAARQARQLYRVGDRLRVGEVDGTLVELTPTMLVLETERGRAAVPAKILDEQVGLVPAGSERDETD